ncbi:porin [Pantoea sp. 18069]|uniref:porin n=1 Tax=Pantoea sp. 18069 TaxID=2681415 RepID=UPI001359FBE4|nr:porin [Pantoea sp. 18069]
MHINTRDIRSTRALAIGLAWACIGGVAAAQSSATISGVVDAGGRHVRNAQGALTSLASGGNSTSRLIFRGSEDLGGGLKAGFWLESTLFTDTGTMGSGGMFFDRASYLSLGSRWGDLRLGRDYTPGFRAIVAADPFAYVGVGGVATAFNAAATTTFQRAFGTGATTFARSNNAIQYFTPRTLGGAYAILMYAPREKTGSASGYGHQAARLGYAAGAFDISATAARTRIDATGEDFAVDGIAGSYRLGALHLSASATQTSYLSSRHNVMGAAAKLLSGVHEFKASFARVDQKGSNAAGASIDADDARILAVGYVHHLSKRTALYLSAAHVSNQGNATYGVPGGPAGAPAGRSSTGYDLGLRHNF